MLTIQIITIAVVALSLIAIYIITKHKGIAISNTAYKIVSGVLAVTFFMRYMWAESEMMHISDLSNSSLESCAQIILALITNWMLYSVILLIIMFPFFRNSKTSALVKYYGTAVVLLYLCTFTTSVGGLFGTDVFDSFDIRLVLIAIELGIMLAYCLAELYSSRGKCAPRDLLVLLIIPAMMLAIMPGYMLEALFGSVNFALEMKSFTLSHRLVIYGSVVLPIVIHVLLKGRDAKTVKGILLYICLAVLISFSTHRRFEEFAELSKWPLHLCHTAMYIIPICIIFNLKKVFYFTYFINVLGAFLALLMPSFGDGSTMFSVSLVRFFMVHYVAFFMPILLVSLGVFERPKIKQFKYSMITFSVYFIVIILVNAYCANFDTDVDFFYLNSDYVVSKLGDWAENTREIVWSIEVGELQFVFYPLYQFLFYIIYVALGSAVWFLYEGMYSFEDTMIDIFRRNKAIRADRLALEVSLAGRTKGDPMNIDTIDKMILNNFSKRYGKSSIYAVKDANLEVCAGDVFGFLGHNGAGKSTIIKSIVGIQPITSGSISVCGYDVDKQSVMAKQCIGFVPDHYALYEKLTGREYLNYIADLYRVSQADRDDAISHYVALFHLDTAIDNQIKTYSHGMKQKVTIMAALIHNPKVWILDEPLTGLDPDSIYQVKQCLKEHAAKGNIVFFSSHLIDIVETVCNKIAIIAKGNILTCDNVSDIQGSLEQYYRTVTEKATSAGIDVSGNLVEA